ncbi:MULTISPECIES: hypothetical protein [Limnospira]|uniref:hypothetical protein n=1 Tax=Limnospira TaxID=2596745 RepID=UPI00066278AC|nr:hypothetical protein [Limnospira indica]QJB27990.1 hypothetical protein HFV01_22190 [Limnospira fusiformis SAG 85.79]RAQ40391.1 hypothetical protein B9S53_16115 [Arthrospira sp. O9.13F]
MVNPSAASEAPAASNTKYKNRPAQAPNIAKKPAAVHNTKIFTKIANTKHKKRDNTGVLAIKTTIQTKIKIALKTHITSPQLLSIIFNLPDDKVFGFSDI